MNSCYLHPYHLSCYQQLLQREQDLQLIEEIMEENHEGDWNWKRRYSKSYFYYDEMASHDPKILDRIAYLLGRTNDLDFLTILNRPIYNHKKYLRELIHP